MKKKRKQFPQGKDQQSQLHEEAADESISFRGKMTIGGGIALLVLGFLVLSRADPMGRNWAASLAPFLILGGYVVIGIGIFVPDPPESAPQPVSPPPAS